MPVLGLSIMPGLSTRMMSLVLMSFRTFMERWPRKGRPKRCKPPKPKSGSSTSVLPSLVVFSCPGTITVKLSSVGATPVCCTDLRVTSHCSVDWPVM